MSDRSWKERIGDWLWGMTPDLDAVESIVALSGVDQWQEAQHQPLAVVYKHSPVCSLSAVTYQEIAKFAEQNPTIPVYFVDVIGSRAVSSRIESDLAVRHESPQVIVIAQGHACWHGSHTRVAHRSIAEAVSTPC